MISQPGLILKGPGLLIPVFFLSLFYATAVSQPVWPVAGSAALGGCYTTWNGFSCASQNQAGLGFAEHSSVTIHHSRPSLLKEIGTSSLSGQFLTGTGALGISLASRGLTGFRQTSLWLSYGLKLNPGTGAGAGIHLWSSTLQDQFIYAPGISFALGLQIRINDRWKLGGGLFHPAGWSSVPGLSMQDYRCIATGFSYAFLNTGHIYSEIHIEPDRLFILSAGLDWTLYGHITFRTGVCTRPFTFSWGISAAYPKWVMELSFLYRIDSGMTPLTSLTYAW